MDVERDRRGIDELVATLSEEAAVIPAIVLAELLVGVRFAPSAREASRRRGKVDALADRLPVVAFDEQVAERWADVRVELAQRGRTIPANDIAVAATALTLDFHVLVGKRDEALFRQVEGLGVIALGA